MMLRSDALFFRLVLQRTSTRRKRTVLKMVMMTTGSPLLRRAVHDGEAKLQMEMDRLAIDRQNANAWE